MQESRDFSLRSPWEAIEGKVALKFESELMRELSSNHVLFGKSITAIAQSTEIDDVLFQIKDTENVFLVHLTYRVEQHANFPITRMFYSLDDFIIYCEQNFIFDDDTM